MSDQEWVELVRAEDVTEQMLESVDDCVEGWFQPDSGPMSTEDFIDKFCDSYLEGAAIDPATGRKWTIENYDTPAARKLMRRARQTRKALAD